MNLDDLERKLLALNEPIGYDAKRRALIEAMLENAPELIACARECASLHLRLAEADSKLAHVEACIAEVLGGLEE